MSSVFDILFPDSEPVSTVENLGVEPAEVTADERISGIDERLQELFKTATAVDQPSVTSEPA